MKRIAAATVLAAAAGLAVLGTGGPAAAADNASVSVVHGIPGTPVNVFVNGKLTLQNFQPGKVAGPLSLPAGSYQVRVFPAANTAGTGNPVISATAQVPAGANVSLVAHLTAAGKPTLTPFVNDTAKLDAGQARLIVRHTAAAPAVDVRAGGRPVFEDVTNGKEGKADVDAGNVSADVVLAGTDTRVLGPADLDLAEGTATIVYAVGSAEDKTLDTVSQTITGLHSAPGGVPSGSGGLADRGTPLTWYAVGVIGVLLALLGAVRLVPARR